MPLVTMGAGILNQPHLTGFYPEIYHSLCVKRHHPISECSVLGQITVYTVPSADSSTLAKSPAEVLLCLCSTNFELTNNFSPPRDAIAGSGLVMALAHLAFDPTTQGIAAIGLCIFRPLEQQLAEIKRRRQDHRKFLLPQPRRVAQTHDTMRAFRVSFAICPCRWSSDPVLMLISQTSVCLCVIRLSFLVATIVPRINRMESARW